MCALELRTYPRLLALQPRGIQYGLERIVAILEFLGHPERSARQTLVVAGTNGKGSVAATVSAGLHADGRSVGLFTSPHLVNVTERFRIGDAEVAPDDFDRVAERLLDAMDRSDIPLSFFEAMTALGAMLFAEAGVETQIFEAGLGGRRDATAALSPTHVTVTSIARDHANVLGHTLKAIATEKLGLCRPGTQNVFNLPGPLRHLAPTGWVLGPDIRRRRLRNGGQRVRYPGGSVDIPQPRLLGDHQRVNAAVAAATQVRLGVRPDAIAASVERVWWPARMQRVEGDPVIWIDGAHNPAAVTQLLETLQQADLEPGYTLVFGAGPKKAAESMLRRLARNAGQVVISTADRLRPAEEVARLSSCPPHARICPEPADALAAARSFGKPILIAGSLYLAGAMLDVLRSE